MGKIAPFLPLIFIISCSSEDCCDSVEDFPAIQVFDIDTGADLLDPKNANAFDTTAIKLWIVMDGKTDFLKRRIYKETYFDGTPIGDFKIDTFEAPLITPNSTTTFYLGLSDSLVDTIEIGLNRYGRTDRILINGTTWHGLSDLIAIYK